MRHKEVLTESLLSKFVPRFAPDSALIYARGNKAERHKTDKDLLNDLDIQLYPLVKMPDVVLYDAKRDWLLLMECATRKRLMDEDRVSELARLFSKAKPDLVYFTAFQNRSKMAEHPGFPTWGTHAWFAEEPEHMMHFNGSRFLGPHAPSKG